MEDQEKELSQPLAIMPMDSTGSLQQAVDRAEKYLALNDRIRRMAVNLTNCNDWIDQNNTPYLEWSGASKVANAFGVSVTGTVCEKETIEDDRGKYVNYFYTGTGSWNGRETQETGSGSTRDSFFGRANGKDLPLSEIDLTDIRKKAMTNFFNRLIKTLLGLSYTWEEIADITAGRITKDKCQGVSYDKGKQGGKVDQDAKTPEKRSKIRQWILDICNNDKAAAIQMLENRTTFKGRDGNMVPGRKSVDELSEKQVQILYSQMEKEMADMDKGPGQDGAK